MANITTIKKGNETMQLGISEDRVNQLIDDKISAMPTGGGGSATGADSKLYDVTIIPSSPELKQPTLDVTTGILDLGVDPVLIWKGGFDVLSSISGSNYRNIQCWESSKSTAIKFIYVPKSGIINVLPYHIAIPNNALLLGSLRFKWNSDQTKVANITSIDFPCKVDIYNPDNSTQKLALTKDDVKCYTTNRAVTTFMIPITGVNSVTIHGLTADWNYSINGYPNNNSVATTAVGPGHVYDSGWLPKGTITEDWPVEIGLANNNTIKYIQICFRKTNNSVFTEQDLVSVIDSITLNTNGDAWTSYMAKEMDAVSRAVRNNTYSTPAVTPTPAVPSTPTPTPAEVKYVTGFIATDPIKPNISTKNLNIDFGTDGILYIGKNHYNLHGNYRNIPIYANGSDTGATMVVYNTVNNTMKTMTWDYTPTADEAIVGTFRLKYHTHEFVSCNFPFEITIDGKNPNIDPDAGDAKDYDVNVKSVNHRGWWECPENTISAYRGSAEHGFKYVETDVAFTSDDVPVLLHDKTINRTGKNPDGSPYATPNKEIKDITFEEVRKLDFGIVRDPKFKGEKIPSFEEFIKCCRNLGLHPYIELKADTQYTEAQVQKVVDIVNLNGMRGKVTYISFSDTDLMYVKNYDPKARLGRVGGKVVDETMINNLKALQTPTNEVFFDGLAFDNNVLYMTEDVAKKLVAINVPLEVWTVDNEADVLKLPSYVSGVTTNKLHAGKVLAKAELNK